MQRSRLLVLVVTVLALLPAAAGAQWQQADEEFSTSGQAGRFGWSVAMAGTLALVGDPSDNGGAGSAHVFQRVNGGDWDLVAVLDPPTASSSGQFGNSVALSTAGGACRAIVGANFAASAKGAAVIYDCGAWDTGQVITASDGVLGDAFGFSVAISGSRALVGATGNDGGGVSNAGAAYVFERDLTGAWLQTAKLVAGDPQGAGNFGQSVALSGSRAAVGANLVDIGSSFDAGAAYVFDLGGSGWVQSAKLVAGDPDPLDKMGWSIALSGGRVLTGAIGDDSIAANSGAVYAFKLDGGAWVQDKKIKAFDAEESDQFGVSVAFAGSWAAIGAPSEDQGGFSAGAIYTFEVDSCGLWHDRGKIVALDGSSGLGRSVAVGFRSVASGWPSVPKTFAIVEGGAGGASGVFSGASYWFEKEIPGYVSDCRPREVG